MSSALVEAVRDLRVADPVLGFKPLLAKLREQQPDLGAATKEVHFCCRVVRFPPLPNSSGRPTSDGTQRPRRRQWTQR